MASYSATDANIGPVGQTDPALRLVVGVRYSVYVNDPLDHPLQIIAKGGTSFDDTLLLSQQTEANPSQHIPEFKESGTFQHDPGVNFVNDEMTQTISFTLTQALADAMSNPSLGLTPGYRCGNPQHRGFQRGDIELTSGPSVAKDPADPTGNSVATATPITLDPSGAGQRSGSLSTAGSVDVVRYVAPVSGLMTVTQRAAAGSPLDSIVFAYDASGKLIGQNGDGGGGKDSLLSFKVNAGEVYYVEATGYLGSTGGYNLGFSTHAMASPAATADSVATPLDGLGAGTTTGQVAMPGAKHDYDFVATLSGRMTITERATAGSPFDSLLTVYNQSGVVLAADDDSGGGLDSLVSLDIVAGQSYRVRAAGIGLSTGTYDLNFSTADVGNTAQSARLVPLSASGSGSVPGHIGLARGEDLYQVTSPTTGTMTALLNSEFNGTVTVVDAANNTLDDFDNIGTAGRVNFAVTQGETFYVRISAFEEETGVFQLFLSFNTNHGTFADAPSLTPTATGYATQVGEIGLPGAADLYRFVAPASGTMVFTLDAIDGTSIDPNLTVFNASQAQLGADDNGGGGLNSRLSIQVEAGHAYYVRAAANGGAIGRYNLTLALAKPANRPIATIGVDAANSGRASGVIGVAGEINTYQFVAATSGSITVRLDASSGGGLDGQLTVLDANGLEIACNDDGEGEGLGSSNSLVTVDVVAGQTYQIQASGFRTSTGGYNLVLGDDYGNDPAHAYPVALDGSGQGSISGRIELPGDLDVFRIVAPSSGPLTVALTTLDGNPIAGLSVIDGSSTMIAAGTSVTNPNSGVAISRATFDSVAGQVYYIQVAGLDQATGSYQVFFDAEADTTAATSPAQVIPAAPGSVQSDGSGTIVLAGDVANYQFTAPVSGVLVITQSVVPGSGFQGSLTVPDASPSYDDASLSPAGPPKGFSRLSLNVVAGQVVPFQVGGVGNRVGQYLLDLRILPFAANTVTTTQILPSDPTQIMPGQNYATPADLVNSLVGAGNATISVVPGSIVYNGIELASGLFNGGTGLLDSREPAGSSPFESGVILTTGTAAGITGPNIDDARSGINNVPGDPNLDKLVAGGTLDASTLSFDFVPTTDLITLRYVFSSEEYNKFVGSPFNDAFGIFINGVDYARVPGTGSPVDGTGDIVSVNTINSQRNSGLFIDNTFGPSGGYGHLNVALNGLTVVLTLSAPVNAGQVNSIKLAIADTIDPNYDSAVFLQANSFQSILNPVDSGKGLAQYNQFIQAVTTVPAANPGLTSAQVNFLIQQAVIDGTIKNLGLLGDYLVVPVDPVDFTLSGPDGLQVSSTGGTMTSNAPNAFFLGSGGNALLIVPNASRGLYKVDLVGVGSGEFLFGASFVTAAKDVTTDLVQGNLRAGGTASILDFQSPSGGVQMISTVSGPSLAGPADGPSPYGGPGSGSSNSGSGQSSALSLLATAVSGLIAGLTVPANLTPNPPTAAPGVGATNASEVSATVTSLSPGQAAATPGVASRGNDETGIDRRDRSPRNPNRLDGLRAIARSLVSPFRDLADELGSGLKVIQDLIDMVRSRSWFSKPAEPRDAIEAPPESEPERVTRPVDAAEPLRPGLAADRVDQEVVQAVADEPSTPAGLAVIILAITAFQPTHRHPKKRSDFIRRALPTRPDGQL